MLEVSQLRKVVIFLTFSFLVSVIMRSRKRSSRGLVVGEPEVESCAAKAARRGIGS